MGLVKRYKFLLILLLVGFLLRLPVSDGRSLYAHNELIRDLEIVKAMDGGNIPLAGPPSSLGSFRFGPVYYYLIFPLAKIFDFAPFSLALTSVISSLGVIGLSYLLIKKYRGDEKLAKLAAILMTFSGFDIYFAKYASNPNFVPFFTLLFFFSLLLLLQKQKTVYAVPLGIGLGIATQLHAAPMIILPIIFALSLYMFRKAIKAKSILLIFLTALIIYFPYLYFEYTSNFTNLLSLFSLTGKSPGSLSLYLDHLSQYTAFWLGPIINLFHSFNVVFYLSSLQIWLIAIALTGVIGSVFINKTRLRPTAENSAWPAEVKRIYFLWLAVPSLFFALPIITYDTFPIYYFLMLHPVVFFTYSLGLYHIYKRGWRLVFYYLFGFFFLLQAIQFAVYNQVVSNLKL